MLGTGIIASTTGINILFSLICTFIFSILLLSVGVIIGNKIIGKFIGKFSNFLSGILLIILGVIELLV